MFKLNLKSNSTFFAKQFVIEMLILVDGQAIHNNDNSDINNL